MTAQEWLATGPLLLIVGIAMLAVLLDIVAPGRERLVTAVVCAGIIGTMALVGYAAWKIDPTVGQQVFGGAYVRDGLTSFLDELFLAIALLTVVFARDYLRPRNLQKR